MKNALTEDNSTGAATAGKKLEAAFKNNSITKRFFATFAMMVIRRLAE